MVDLIVLILHLVYTYILPHTQCTCKGILLVYTENYILSSLSLKVSSKKEQVPQKRTYPASKGSRVWTHQPGGKNGAIAGINKLPSISSSKKASKPFKPPGHVTQGTVH